ncbi:MAG: hypothetical protein A2293_12610 [Elusimicrobia bacterium RIFOXYB2_FULL_49_7]|nr:MAG: hypothetical protein A2293_12610 [Elusimicrobia bacterium RIFOXYB2_FULL_49_7]
MIYAGANAIGADSITVWAISIVQEEFIALLVTGITIMTIHGGNKPIGVIAILTDNIITTVLLIILLHAIIQAEVGARGAVRRQLFLRSIICRS